MRVGNAKQHICQHNNSFATYPATLSTCQDLHVIFEHPIGLRWYYNADITAKSLTFPCIHSGKSLMNSKKSNGAVK